jgi:hypothetical protein
MNGVFNTGRVLLQFLPLTVFLNVAFQNGAPQTADWLNAFMWGGVAAVLQLVLTYFLLQGLPFNRLILGVNFYLILGGAAVLTNQIALLKILGNLKESGIFLCVLIIGICTTVVSKAGFIGVMDISSPSRLQQYSVWLLLLTFAAVAASFWFRGKPIFSAAIPLIVLSVASRLFKIRLQRKHGDGIWM